jgi:hypothetical protein
VVDPSSGGMSRKGSCCGRGRPPDKLEEEYVNSMRRAGFIHPPVLPATTSSAETSR